MNENGWPDENKHIGKHENRKAAITAPMRKPVPLKPPESFSFGHDFHNFVEFLRRTKVHSSGNSWKPVLNTDESRQQFEESNKRYNVKCSTYKRRRVDFVANYVTECLDKYWKIR